MRRRAGFTLVELCCVVGIVAILSNVAATSYSVYVLRAQATEALMNVETMAYLEQVRILEVGAPISCAPEPAAVPSSTSETPTMFVSNPCWKDLGFKPVGPVRFQYEAKAGEGRAFQVFARGDLDGDGVLSEYSIDSTTMTVSRVNAD